MGSPQRFATPEGRVALGRYFLLTERDSRKVLDLFYDPAIKEQPGPGRSLPGDRRAGAGQAGFRPRRRHPEEGTQGRRRRPALPLPARQCLFRGRPGRLREGAGRGPQDQPAPRRQPAPAGRPPGRRREIRRGRRDSQAGPRGQPARAAGVRLPGRPGPPAERRRGRDRRASLGAGLVGRQPRGRPPDRPEALAEVPLRRGLGVSASGTRDGQGLSARRIQLCQDLLRLGDEDEGWKLAAAIFADDAYNVVAYNLTTLHDRIAGFRTLQGDGFIVRMDPREADLYGQRVLDLLARAGRRWASGTASRRRPR